MRECLKVNMTPIHFVTVFRTLVLNVFLKHIYINTHARVFRTKTVGHVATSGHADVA